MFTVLILNQKTTESFNEHYPLFLNAINNEEVAVCNWYEAGGNIDAILPDLHSITDDKKAWRAVIVRVEDDIELYKSADNNPYDYSSNKNLTNEVSESEIPLIRLTHYLAGFPAPEVEFKAELVGSDKYKYDDNGNFVDKNDEVSENEILSSKIIYKSIKNLEKQEKYNALFEKYNYSGKKPQEIILFTLRRKKEVPEINSIERAWTNYDEINSSTFWKRNNYPSLCRFVVFDLENNGPIQNKADMFNFWSSVLMLCVNEIEPAYLQAYRLYCFNSLISLDELKEELQNYATKLIGSKRYIEKKIQEDIEKKLAEKKDLPSFQVNVPVSIDSPKRNEFQINPDKFSLVSDSYKADQFAWQDMKANAYNEIDNCVDRSVKALDESADIMRQLCDVRNDTIKPLDKYQKNEINNELASLYSKIIRLQGRLPKKSTHFQKKMIESEKNIKKQMSMRISTRQFVVSLSLIAFTLLFSLFPAGVFYSKDNVGSTSTMLIAFLVMIGIFTVTQLVVLLVQKREFSNQIADYNAGLNSSVGEMGENAHLYSDFISAVATHIKGKNYLKALSRMKFEEDKEYVNQKKHLRAIDSFLDSIQKWNDAFDLEITFEINEDFEQEVDCEKSPQFSPSYELTTNIDKEVQINDSGVFLESPYMFIERLILEREELYDEFGS